MFKLLRSKAKIFYWVIAASFILFIFLAWGMDFTGSRRGGGNRPSGMIGSVNGVPISAYDWDSAYQNYMARMRQQNPDQNITPNQRANAAQQVWDMLVRDRIEAAAVEQMGLTATSDEILDILKNDPPPELLAQYRDEEGNPDLAAYFSDLSNPNRDWSGVEAYLRHQLPRQKLYQIIVAGATVTDAEIREAYLRQKGRAVAEYIGLRFADITMEEEPTEEEITAYYESHLGLYQRPERVRLQAVHWAKEPSESDREEVRQLTLEIKAEIEAGELDFEEAVSIYSQDDRSAAEGGDLGTFTRDRMVEPFSTAAFALEIGQISEPVETQFGYHLIEVLEQIQEDDAEDQIHARHILLEIEPGEEALASIYEQVEDFRLLALKDGFVAVATAESLQVMAPDPLVEGRDIPGLVNSMEGSVFAFRAEPGEMSPILDNGDAYYLVFVEELIPAGPAPLEEVRRQVEVKVTEDKKREIAEQKLQPAVTAIRAGQSFADAATEFELKSGVTDTITASSNVPDVGYGTAFNTIAMEVPVGTLVPEVATRRGLFALRTLWQESLDEQDYLAQKESLRGMVLSRKQQELSESWFDQKLAQAKIEDFRYDRRSGDS
jgi:parvulin-like peptidyl-prolyl isomerase